MQTVTSAEVARLYDELRDCIRANDQEGAKRIFSELVRAGRPYAEILGGVTSASKSREWSESERDDPPIEAWPQPPGAADAGQSAANPTFDNFDQATDASRVPETADRVPLATRFEPEEDASPLDETMGRVAPAEAPEPAAEPAVQSSGRADGAGVEAAETVAVAAVRRRSVESGGVEARSRGRHSGRRIAALISPTARLRASLIALVAIVGVNGFLILHPGGEKIVAGPVPPVADAATPPESLSLTAVPSAANLSTAAAASTTASEPAPEFATPKPMPASAALPQTVSPPGSDGLALPKPEATTSLAKLEPPRDTVPVGSAASEAVAPAAPAAVAKPIEASRPDEPRPTAETAALLERGDSLFGTGDVASARLFYERAADAGDGRAALRLGETYDPNFLEHAHLRAVRGDIAAAVIWYQRARELGASEAEILLKGIYTQSER